MASGFIMDKNVILRHTIFPDGHNFEGDRFPVETQTLCALLAKNHLFPVPEVKLGVFGMFFTGKFLKNLVVIDNAILENLDKGRPDILFGPEQGCRQFLDRGVNATGDKPRPGPEGKNTGRYGRIHRPHRG